MDLTHARVGRHIFLDHAGSRLRLDGGSVDAPGAVALKCCRASAPELVLRTAGPIQGTVSLQYASFGIIRDDPGTWPGELLLDGLSYDILDSPLPAQRRLALLARDPGGRLSQPYEQLAANYRSLGAKPTLARSSWPGSGHGGPLSRGTRKPGATCRTSPSATATGQPGRHFGWPPC